MAQINLLKQSGSTHHFGSAIPKIVVRILVVVLLVLLGYYIWLFVTIKSTEDKIFQAQAKLNTDKQAALTIQNRDELFTRQLQLKSLADIISKHVYWSQLLPELARVTLKTSSYSTMRASADGSVDLSVTVPNLSELDKYMQVFDVAEFNENFNDIRIGGFSKVVSEKGTTIQFAVKMKYKPELIQYKPPTK